MAQQERQLNRYIFLYVITSNPQLRMCNGSNLLIWRVSIISTALLAWR